MLSKRAFITLLSYRVYLPRYYLDQAVCCCTWPSSLPSKHFRRGNLAKPKQAHPSSAAALQGGTFMDNLPV